MNRTDFSPWLAGVYVTSSERGKGIASLLCKRIQIQAERLGFPSIYLYTKTPTLYSTLGWGAHSVEQYKGNRVTVMKLKLFLGKEL